MPSLQSQGGGSMPMGLGVAVGLGVGMPGSYPHGTGQPFYMNMPPGTILPMPPGIAITMHGPSMIRHKKVSSRLSRG